MKKLLIIFLLLTNFNQAFAQNQISSKQMMVGGFADIIEDILPSVVNISATQEVRNSSNKSDDDLLNELPKIPLFEDFKNRLESQLKEGGQRKKVSSIGSGFLISKDGFIVTNNHVIDDADEITVSLNDGSKYKAKIIGIDKKTDLALLKISTNKELKFVNFGDSNKARIGDWVIVVGNPYGLGGSVTVGIVSARGRSLNNNIQSEEFIQTDAAINKGNSGGPIFNTKGEVIGISSAIFSPSGGNVGIGFASPSSVAAPIIKQLKEQGEIVRSWIGISIQDISDEMASTLGIPKSKGALVTDVTPEGPADKAGIIASDVIIKIGNQEVVEMKTLPQAIAQMPIGKSIPLTILRQGKIKILSVKIAKMPKS